MLLGKERSSTLGEDSRRQYILARPVAVAHNNKLRAWFVGDGLGGDEIGFETGGVAIEQPLDVFGALGLEDEADVVVLGDAVRDFGIGVGGGIGMFLAGERKNDGGIVSARWGKLVRLIPCPDFEAGPFAPEVDAGGGFDDVGDVGAADAGGNFNEIKSAVGMRAEELGMSDAAHEAEPFEQMAIDLEQRFGLLGVARKSARREHAALMGGIERRSAVGVSFSENNVAIRDHAIHVKDRAGDELFQ